MKTFNRILSDKVSVALKVYGMLILVLLSGTSRAQRYPATTSIQLLPPHSVDLEDYSQPGNDRVLASVVFNDFSQSSWSVKLRLTIEGSGVLLQTNPEASIEAIRLVAGTLEQFTGYDLAPYFDLRNMRVQGMTAGQITANGGLPEGNYTFILEAVDARTGIVISNKSQANAWLILNDPPQITFPICGDRLSFGDPQNIVFQWLPMHTNSPNRGSNTEYEFTLVEVADGINANEAILSAMPMLQTTITAPNFIYGISEPLLENGKTYAFRIRALDSEGLSLFKNEGYSPVCWFNYGYPVNGQLTTLRPGNNELIDAKDQPVFAWSAPSNLVPQQLVSYVLKIVELNDGSDPVTAMEDHTQWHEETTGNMSSPTGSSLRLPKALESEKSFAWQVKAFSDGIEVARSAVVQFSVTPEVKQFTAGSHIVKIISISSGDLKNFSGTGKLKLLEDGTEFDIEFSRLKIESLAGKLIMASGDIEYTLPESFADIVLPPAVESNGQASFDPASVRLTRNGLEISGTVHWPLPWPLQTGEQAFVRTDAAWMNFDNLKLNGYAKLASGNSFRLMDPFGFELNLLTTSNFFLRENQFTQNFDTEIILPEHVKGPNSTPVKLVLKQARQLFTNEIASLDKAIVPLNNVGIQLIPTRITLDLSGQSSPGNFSASPGWQGVYFNNFDIVYLKEIDKNQLRLNEPVRHSYSISENVKGWVDGEGLDFAFTKTFDAIDKDYSTFNQFPGTLTTFSAEVENNNLISGEITGNIRIPLLAKEYFAYSIALSNDGLEQGYLKDDLAGKSYKINAMRRTVVSLNIIQAVFAENDRLDLSIGLDWPEIGWSIDVISDFKIWGNGQIGFSQYSGRKHLPDRIEGNLNGYPIVITQVGAGYHGGNYFLNAEAEITLAEDVSGENGPVRVSFYSTKEVENAMHMEAGQQTNEKSLESNYNLDLIAKKTIEDDDLLIDSTFIKFDVALGSCAGFLKFTANDPDWGNSWQGSLLVEMRIPTRIRVNAMYVLGRTNDGLDYWFIEGGLATGGADQSDAGLTMARRAGANAYGNKKRGFNIGSKLRDGVNLFGVCSLVGLDFRAYHHMSRGAGQSPNEKDTDPLAIQEVQVIDGGRGVEFEFVPDRSVNYGLFGAIAITDRATQGQVFNFVGGVEYVSKTDGVVLGMEGTIELGTSGGASSQPAPIQVSTQPPALPLPESKPGVVSPASPNAEPTPDVASDAKPQPPGPTASSTQPPALPTPDSKPGVVNPASPNAEPTPDIASDAKPQPTGPTTSATDPDSAPDASGKAKPATVTGAEPESKTTKNKKSSGPKVFSATGSGKLLFDTSQDLVVGDFWLTLASPAFCAQGNLAFRSQNNDLTMAFGNPERRLLFIMGCQGWGATGWLRFNSTNADFGAGVVFQASAETGWIGNPVFFSFNARADFGAELGLMAAVALKPSFQVEKVGVWAEVLANVACDYKAFGASGTWVIASANLSGNMIVHFPSTSNSSLAIEGDLEGEINVLHFSAGFSTTFKHSL